LTDSTLHLLKPPRAYHSLLVTPSNTTSCSNTGPFGVSSTACNFGTAARATADRPAQATSMPTRAKAASTNAGSGCSMCSWVSVQPLGEVAAGWRPSGITLSQSIRNGSKPYGRGSTAPSTAITGHRVSRHAQHLPTKSCARAHPRHAVRVSPGGWDRQRPLKQLPFRRLSRV
jgi:hypothetical protein